MYTENILFSVLQSNFDKVNIGQCGKKIKQIARTLDAACLLKTMDERPQKSCEKKKKFHYEVLLALGRASSVAWW